MPYSEFVAFHLHDGKVVFRMREERKRHNEIFLCYEVDSSRLRGRLGEVWPGYIDKRRLQFQEAHEGRSAAEGLLKLLTEEKYHPKLLSEVPASAMAFERGIGRFENLTDTLDGRLMKQYNALCRLRLLVDDDINSQ